MTCANCYNRGCGQKFEIDQNEEDACAYHPGEPVFHDTYKQWSCCQKRTTDFTEFLNIKGCTRGRHNPDKPKSIVKEKPKVSDAVVSSEVHNVWSCKPPEPACRSSCQEPLVPLSLQINESVYKQKAEWKTSKRLEPVAQEEINETLPIGAPCRNTGCLKICENAHDTVEECLYHPGSAVFHEGMKYWSCCQRRTSDFNVFLNQRGCTTDKHNFKTVVVEKSKCRYDWFQTGQDVTINIYARGVVPEQCKVEANAVQLESEISYDQGESIFLLRLQLWGAVNVDKSLVTYNASKVEITLKKLNAGAWAALEYPK